MAKLTIKLFGKDYHVNCTEGEEDRLLDIVGYVDGKLKDIATRTGNNTVTESRLFMLTCLHLADELFDARTKASEAANAAAVEQEDLLVTAVEHLSQRIAHIAGQVGRA